MNDFLIGNKGVFSIYIRDREEHKSYIRRFILRKECKGKCSKDSKDDKCTDDNEKNIFTVIKKTYIALIQDNFEDRVIQTKFNKLSKSGLNSIEIQIDELY